MPASVSYYQWHFSSSFISISAAVSSAFWRTAQHLERDVVLFGSSAGLGVLQVDLCWVIEQGSSSCLLEDFGNVSVEFQAKFRGVFFSGSAGH